MHRGVGYLLYAEHVRQPVSSAALSALFRAAGESGKKFIETGKEPEGMPAILIVAEAV